VINSGSGSGIPADAGKFRSALERRVLKTVFTIYLFLNWLLNGRLEVPNKVAGR
jgi:hypothetical protein